ncbi:MAG: beta-propeller domain-containing protein [Proteobacteria bacterium]|nr:beta-propeller domain-containing protein [Pseudomonadota bacterium]
MVRTPLTLLPLALTAALVGCGEPKSELKPFDSCEDMRRYMAVMADQEVRSGNSFEIRGGIANDFATESSGEMAPQAAPSDVSGTNLQESGVDEADLVKTDGTHIFAVSGSKVVISKAWPIEEAAQLATVRIDGLGSGLYLDGDRLVAISEIQWGGPSPRGGNVSGWREGATTVVTMIDISDPASPEVVREAYTSGRLKETRRIEDDLYVVTYDDLELGFWGREARKRIRYMGVEGWQSRLADFTRSGEDWAVVDGPACACEDTYASSRYGGTSVTSVMKLDLSDANSAFDGTAVVGLAEAIYASERSLYVAYSDRGDNWAFGTGNLETVVHRFDIEGARPEYTSTGNVIGVLEDRFGLDEENGVLRIATTDISGTVPSSGIYTLEESGGHLVELDSVDGLAPGEGITGARFLGKVGYIVTWEMQLGDPLFVFDLSDPSQIVAGGALEVTGRSDYIQPIGPDHLLGVGADANGALAVSLFDVSDMDDPQLADRISLPSWGSEAQNESHAFNYFGATETLSIPAWGNQGSVLEVLSANTDGVSRIGAMQPSLQAEDYWCGDIRRSIVMDDYVWAMSSSGLTASRWDTPSEVLAEVEFTSVDPCEWAYGYENF